MKKLCILLLICVGTIARAQTPTYQEKLYYTAKTWGYAKYFHSRVSTCLVNWDSVLVAFLPRVKAAATSNGFNDLLDSMLTAAGPMDVAVTSAPPPLPPELRRNLNFSWFNDPALRADVKILLDTIKNNFRPHANCWIANNTGSVTNAGWLVFPGDSIILNLNSFATYPGEEQRLLMLCKYWNIINYFNPHNYVLDRPWDSSLYTYGIEFANVPNAPALEKLVQKITKDLNDAHAEGLTYNLNTFYSRYYCPYIVLRYVDNKYVVVKSSISNISIGDEIVSVDGLTTTQWEDSLRPYISAGNPAVFHRQMCVNMLGGPLNSNANLVYKDSFGVSQSLIAVRAASGSWTSSYYPNDTLQFTKWTTLPCNVGYVNMGYLQPADVNQMYGDLSGKPAIIFDIRNYPAGTAWSIAGLMYDNRHQFAKDAEPDVTYPGTYKWHDDYLGIVGGSATPYYGQVIILMNQETQSQAEYSCMILEQLPNVIKVGSQTAGADGNVSYFRLTKDVMQTGFTSMGIYYPNGDSTQRIGIVPDVMVLPTQVGVRHRRDELLEKALQIACALGVIEVNTASAGSHIYPNPTTSVITVENNFGATDFLLRDVSGRIVAEAKLSGEKERLQMPLLPPGMYLSEIRNGAGIRRFDKVLVR